MSTSTDASIPPAGPAPLRVRPLLGVAAIYALTFAAVFWFLWSPLGDRKALGWDMLTEYWGDVAYQAKWLASGDLPLWNPYERLGFPSYADPQAGQFYPLNWLTWPLAWLGDGMPYWSVALKSWLHLTLGAVGMFAFLRRRGEVAPACWMGGYLFALAPPIISFAASALLWPISWLPWIWIALDRLLEAPGWRRGLILGGVMAMPVLAGNPPSLFYMLIAVTFMGTAGVVGAWRRLEPGARWGYLKPLLMGLSIGALVAALLGAPALLPVQEVFSQSVRTARDANFVLRTDLTPYKLLGLLLPDVNNRGFHYGLFTLCLAAVALWKRPRAATWPALLFLFGALVALGGNGFLLKGLASILPPFGLFRGPHRYATLCSAGLSVWAAMGMTALVRAEAAERRRVAWISASVAALIIVGFSVGAAVMAGQGGKAAKSLEQQALTLGALLALLVVVIVVLMLRQRAGQGATPAWAWAVVPATVIAVWAGGTRVHGSNFFPVPETARDGAIERIGYDVLKGRLYDDNYLMYRPGVRLAVRDISGYEGDPLGSRRYDDVIKRARRQPALLRHLGARWYLRGPRHRMLPHRMQLRAIQRDKQFVRVEEGVWRVEGSAPQVAVFPQVVQKKTPAEARNHWMKAAPGHAAVVATDDLGGALPPDLKALVKGGSGQATPGTLTSLSPDHVEAKVSSAEGGLAVFLEAWYPAWQATVDGEPAEIHRVNYLFRGVVVPPGEHTVRMEFRPWRFSASAALFGLGLLALFGGLWISRRR